MNDLETLINAGQKRGIEKVEIEKALQPEDRTAQMIGLRELGLALNEVGTYFHVQKQRVSQVTGTKTGLRAAPLVRDVIPVENVVALIWEAATEKPTMWSPKDRIYRNEVVHMFVSRNYTWDEARAHSSLCTKASSLDVLLKVKYNIEMNPIAQKAWFTEALKTQTVEEIHRSIDTGQRLDVFAPALFSTLKRLEVVECTLTD